MVENFSRIDAWGQSRGELSGLVFERYLQTIGHECNKNMRLDPLVRLVVNGPDREVPFQFFKGLFDFSQLYIIPPKHGGISCGQI